jgi:hypothetical protein
MMFELTALDSQDYRLVSVEFGQISSALLDLYVAFELKTLASAINSFE